MKNKAPNHGITVETVAYGNAQVGEARVPAVAFKLHLPGKKQLDDMQKKDKYVPDVVAGVVMNTMSRLRRPTGVRGRFGIVFLGTKGVPDNIIGPVSKRILDRGRAWNVGRWLDEDGGRLYIGQIVADEAPVKFATNHPVAFSEG